MLEVQAIEFTVSSDDKELLLHLYERMQLIRQFELRVEMLFAEGKLPGFVHLYTGQEAIAVGVCSTLNTDDFITSTHRGHGHTIAKGGDVRRMMAELFGKSTGYCKGKGGSMHITDMSIGMLGANGIVAGGIPMAVGAAYGAAKIRKTKQVAVPFFGDGATNEGAFHEAANMASAWDLPVVFACENNLYGVGTRLDRVCATSEVSVRASGYSIPSVIVDGNDVLAVREAALQAVAKARAGGGPTFLECRTWRHRGHFEGEVITYWEQEEVKEWMARDPLLLLANRLTEAGIATTEELAAIEQAVVGQIDDAVAFAESSPLPNPEEALDDVYA
ncbi:MAG: thiamine pyrophosphate-dependent dehydrogenase E1 component subunit alpha [Chloroflexota bacterium]